MDLDLPNSPFSKPDYGHGFHPEWSFVRIFRSPSSAVPLQYRKPRLFALVFPENGCCFSPHPFETRGRYLHLQKSSSSFVSEIGRKAWRSLPTHVDQGSDVDAVAFLKRRYIDGDGIPLSLSYSNHGCCLVTNCKPTGHVAVRAA